MSNDKHPKHLVYKGCKTSLCDCALGHDHYNISEYPFADAAKYAKESPPPAGRGKSSVLVHIDSFGYFENTA